MEDRGDIFLVRGISYISYFLFPCPPRTIFTYTFLFAPVISIVSAGAFPFLVIATMFTAINWSFLGHRKRVWQSIGIAVFMVIALIFLWIAGYYILLQWGIASEIGRFAVGSISVVVMTAIYLALLMPSQNKAYQRWLAANEPAREVVGFHFGLVWIISIVLSFAVFLAVYLGIPKLYGTPVLFEQQGVEFTYPIEWYAFDRSDHDNCQNPEVKCLVSFDDQANDDYVFIYYIPYASDFSAHDIANMLLGDMEGFEIVKPAETRLINALDAAEITVLNSESRPPMVSTFVVINTGRRVLLIELFQLAGRARLPVNRHKFDSLINSIEIEDPDV